MRALLADGWELAAHTITHPDLTTVGPARLRREVAGSRAPCGAASASECGSSATRPGATTRRTERAVRAAGFRGATTTTAGIAAPHGDPFALPRLRMLPEEAPAALLAALR